MRALTIVLTACFSLMVSVATQAQAMFFDKAKVSDSTEIAARNIPTFCTVASAAKDSIGDSIYAVRSLDELYTFLDTISYDRYEEHMNTRRLPRYYFMPSVYDTYLYPDTTDVFAPDFSGMPEMRWVEEQNAIRRQMDRINRHLFFQHPFAVTYNINLLPEPPKKFHAVVDPTKHTIEIRETISSNDLTTTLQEQAIKEKHWIKAFSASLQFSQAFVSPNWYQGGNNNINVLANIYYNVKLNQKYHPNLLFETTAQYKVGVNSAPDDTIHGYNISDDLLQINSTFGVKAARRWYYSLTAQFKTQLLNSYATNSRDLRSAFLSPAELTAGVGMTYNYANEKKTVTFDASLAPLSYSLKTCTNRHLNPENYGIEPGRKTSHNFGSSAELKFFWKISYNISFSSRLFAFTNYDTAQADWENKVNFEINRFLSTQLYVHARYDSSTPPCDDKSWKKLQLKEILSIGFAYKFSTI